MKIKITMKDPDCLYEPIEEMVKAEIAAIPGLDEDEREALQEKRQDQIRSKLTKKWFEYGEYATIEIDTEADTATVIPHK